MSAPSATRTCGSAPRRPTAHTSSMQAVSSESNKLNIRMSTLASGEGVTISTSFGGWGYRKFALNHTRGRTLSPRAKLEELITSPSSFLTFRQFCGCALVSMRIRHFRYGSGSRTRARMIKNCKILRLKKFIFHFNNCNLFTLRLS
jgi:hypothetical protein